MRPCPHRLGNEGIYSLVEVLGAVFVVFKPIPRELELMVIEGAFFDSDV